MQSEPVLFPSSRLRQLARQGAKNMLLGSADLQFIYVPFPMLYEAVLVLQKFYTVLQS